MAQKDTNPEDMQMILAMYQLIMADVEPELLNENMQLLPERYVAETKPERTARLKRYERAFLECFRRMDMVLDQMKINVEQFQQEVKRRLNMREESDRQTQSAQAEQLLDDAS